MFSISKRESLSNWNIKSNAGVRNLNATHEKYLFRSLLTTKRTPLGVLFSLVARRFGRGAPWCSRFSMSVLGFREEQAPPLRSRFERANHGAKRSCVSVRRDFPQVLAISPILCYNNLTENPEFDGGIFSKINTLSKSCCSVLLWRLV